MGIMPRKSKKEDKEDGEINFNVVKNDSDSEDFKKASPKSEETILFLKNQIRSDCPEDVGEDKFTRDDSDIDEDEDSPKKRRISIILRIAVFLLVAAAFVFGLKIANRNGYTGCLSDNGIQAGTCGTNLKKLEDGIAVDKIRLSDASSIVAGLQEYSIDKKGLPEKMTSLLAGGYIEKEYSDPEFDKLYFYKKQSSNSYSLCAYLSTGVWGVNVSGCPSKENYLSGLAEEAPATSTKTVTVQETSIGWLNIRKSATTDSAVIAKAYAGEQYKVLEEKGDWIRIPLKSSVLVNGEQVIEGWVYKSYVK
jgi:hypothetical protein